MAEIMTELLDGNADETIMAEVSNKLDIGSYDVHDSGESGIAHQEVNLVIL